VLGVCRGILRNHHNADDAFQATFLVLVRKARSIRVNDSLAPWLWSVAWRTARRARLVAARYRPIDTEPIEESSVGSPDHAELRDVWPLLHEELDRLPGKFRDAIVLCHLEGKSHEEAARLLHWPIGTVNSRLSRGRRLLRFRLERRGVGVSSAVFSASWLACASTAVSLPVLESTITAAIGTVTARAVPELVLTLTRGVLKTMWLRKFATNTLAAFTIIASTGGFAVWAHWPSASRNKSSVAQAVVPGGASEHARPLARDTESAPKLVAAAAASPQPAGDVPCIIDCPLGALDGLPADCPISVAANALSRVIDHFHQPSAPSQ
jgi:RNA polymerase sigma factor (sigma-70 family)